MASTPEKVGLKQRLRQILQVFNFVRGHDRLIVPLMLLAFGLPIIIGVVVAIFTSQWLLIPLAVLIAVLAALVIFSRRVQKATYAQVEGQPGAALAVLESMPGNRNQRNWKFTPAVQISQQQDVVHRVVGRPGVILLGEGSPHRVKQLISQERKRVNRVLSDVPVYDVVVGEDEDKVSIRKLQSHLTKLPKNLTPGQVGQVAQRLQGLGGARPPIPKGPMPTSGRAMKGAKQQMYRGR
jgi:ABC-type multidrug transport system fused ATPase/permease subunit